MNNFKVISRDKNDCEHDTGVMHSVTMPCEIAENMVKKTHMRESDPQHQSTWHKGGGQ